MKSCKSASTTYYKRGADMGAGSLSSNVKTVTQIAGKKAMEGLVMVPSVRWAYFEMY